MSDTPTPTEPLQFGWEEWISLPDIGVPALRAKVDTGARTSALHAFDIETFGPSSKPKVRFTVHPIPGRDDLVIPCSAPIIDRREVASSNGEKELRYVIESTLSVNGDSWPIEITLTNRSTMTSRMLLGRQALKDHISIVATDRFLQPELSYDVYHTSKMRAAQPNRALRIAVLSREDNYSTRRLVEEGEKRGHSVEVINTTRCYMAINAMAPGTLRRKTPAPLRCGDPAHRRFDHPLWHRHHPAVRNHRHLLRQRQRRDIGQPGQTLRPSNHGPRQDRNAQHRLRRLSQRYRQPHRSCRYRAADRETSGIHPGQRRGAGRNQKGRRIRHRRLSRPQGQFPCAGFRQGSRGRRHPLPRDRRQGRGLDETYRRRWRFSLQPAPGRFRQIGPHQQGRTRNRDPRRQGLQPEHGRCRPAALRGRAKSA